MHNTIFALFLDFLIPIQHGSYLRVALSCLFLLCVVPVAHLTYRWKLASIQKGNHLWQSANKHHDHPPRKPIRSMKSPCMQGMTTIRSAWPVTIRSVFISTVYGQTLKPFSMKPLSLLSLWRQHTRDGLPADTISPENNFATCCMVPNNPKQSNTDCLKQQQGWHHHRIHQVQRSETPQDNKERLTPHILDHPTTQLLSPP